MGAVGSQAGDITLNATGVITIRQRFSRINNYVGNGAIGNAGGLPPNPGDALSTDAVMVDLITLNPEVDQPSNTAVSTSRTSSKPARIVEAQGWAIDANGEVILTANASTLKLHGS